jgi:hypothetical protein
MSEDKLKEIKNLRRNNGSSYRGITVTRKASEYVDWLVAELEQAKAEVKRLKAIMGYVGAGGG